MTWPGRGGGTSLPPLAGRGGASAGGKGGGLWRAATPSEPRGDSPQHGTDHHAGWPPGSEFVIPESEPRPSSSRTRGTRMITTWGRRLDQSGARQHVDVLKLQSLARSPALVPPARTRPCAAVCRAQAASRTFPGESSCARELPSDAHVTCYERRVGTRRPATLAQVTARCWAKWPQQMQ